MEKVQDDRCFSHTFPEYNGENMLREDGKVSMKIAVIFIDILLSGIVVDYNVFRLHTRFNMGMHTGIFCMDNIHCLCISNDHYFLLGHSFKVSI